jgi:hypothetical protein
MAPASGIAASTRRAPLVPSSRIAAISASRSAADACRVMVTLNGAETRVVPFRADAVPVKVSVAAAGACA